MKRIQKQMHELLGTINALLSNQPPERRFRISIAQDSDTLLITDPAEGDAARTYFDHYNLDLFHCQQSSTSNVLVHDVFHKKIVLLSALLAEIRLIEKVDPSPARGPDREFTIRSLLENINRIATEEPPSNRFLVESDIKSTPQFLTLLSGSREAKQYLQKHRLWMYYIDLYHLKVCDCDVVTMLKKFLSTIQRIKEKTLIPGLVALHSLVREINAALAKEPRDRKFAVSMDLNSGVLYVENREMEAAAINYFNHYRISEYADSWTRGRIYRCTILPETPTTDPTMGVLSLHTTVMQNEAACEERCDASSTSAPTSLGWRS